MFCVQIHAYGGLDALKYEEVKMPAPAEGEVLIKVAAAGVNFIDTYQRTGLYKNPTGQFPWRLGKEGAGTVEAVGAGVDAIKVGDKVVSSGAQGSYAQYVCVAAASCVALPDGVSPKDAAAAMLQGLTAHYLVKTTYKLGNGDTCLIHAGAGGTGGLLIQIAKLLGATVLTTVSTAQKAEIAKGYGADHVINYAENDFHEEVMRITDGKKVNVVFDGVGKATWEKSLKSIAPQGHLVLFGNASGAVPPIDPLLLTRSGSITLSRPSLVHHVGNGQLAQRAKELFGWIGDGKVKVTIGKEYKLEDARQAQDDLSTRKTIGKLLLIPS